MRDKDQVKLHQQMASDFKKELQIVIKHKLDEINHYIAGCDSPFTYSQIMNVQGFLNDISSELGIETESEPCKKNTNDDKDTKPPLHDKIEKRIRRLAIKAGIVPPKPGEDF